jgi:hypothetical protein
MPLDADDVTGRGVDERLHEPIVGVRGGDQPLSEAVDALSTPASAVSSETSMSFSAKTPPPRR